MIRLEPSGCTDSPQITNPFLSFSGVFEGSSYFRLRNLLLIDTNLIRDKHLSL